MKLETGLKDNRFVTENLLIYYCNLNTDRSRGLVGYLYISCFNFFLTISINFILAFSNNLRL